jgi:hypothetical protein
MTFERQSIAESIQQGATVADIAAQHNVSWGEAAAEIDRLGISRPNAQQDTVADRLVRSYLGLVEETRHATHDQLMRQPDGSILGLPLNFSIQNIDLNRIFERFHGPAGYVDPYNGAQTGSRILIVNSSESQAGRPRNFLCTNIETLSAQTIEERFCNWMRPIMELFGFEIGDWHFILTVQRPYDKLVGGTYSQAYMEVLFDRWVGQPLAQYGTVSAEREQVFRFSTPFELAWWAWDQLTHVGLLKGLTELRVTHEVSCRSAVLRDDDVQNAIIGYSLKDQKGSPLIVQASQMPPAGKPPMGNLIR